MGEFKKEHYSTSDWLESVITSKKQLIQSYVSDIEKAQKKIKEIEISIEHYTKDLEVLKNNGKN